MRVVFDGVGLIGVDVDVLKALMSVKCGPPCFHSSFSHKEQGCQIQDCECKRGYNTYLLLQSEEFLHDVVKEGLL